MSRFVDTVFDNGGISTEEVSEHILQDDVSGASLKHLVAPCARLWSEFELKPCSGLQKGIFFVCFFCLLGGGLVWFFSFSLEHTQVIP